MRPQLREAVAIGVTQAAALPTPVLQRGTPTGDTVTRRRWSSRPAGSSVLRVGRPPRGGPQDSSQRPAPRAGSVGWADKSEQPRRHRVRSGQGPRGSEFSPRLAPPHPTAQPGTSRPRPGRRLVWVSALSRAIPWARAGCCHGQSARRRLCVWRPYCPLHGARTRLHRLLRKWAGSDTRKEGAVWGAAPAAAPEFLARPQGYPTSLESASGLRGVCGHPRPVQLPLAEHLPCDPRPLNCHNTCSQVSTCEPWKDTCAELSDSGGGS